MTIDALLADTDLRRLLTLLDADGEEARVVGGAVRNALLGRPLTDVDITTTALPEAVIARAEAAHLRVIPTGLAHGTVTIRVGAKTFEVTTLREDVETDGRHATVRFGRDFATDALRRDFTINALSVGLDGKVHDYTDGLADLAAGRVRFIGDARARIREDYLRILRFFRFSAEYATGALDGQGLSAAIKERGGLHLLSRERVRQELLKLLMAKRAVFAATQMRDAGLLTLLLADVAMPARLARLIAFAPETDAIGRLAALAVRVAEDAAHLQDRLRLSNAETARLARAAEASLSLHAPEIPSLGLLREALYRHGREAALDGLHLAYADRSAGTDDKAWRRAESFLRDTPIPVLPFSSSDLAARGIKPGRSMGELLKRLQADWIRAGFPSDPRRVAQLLDDAARGPV